MNAVAVARQLMTPSTAETVDVSSFRFFDSIPVGMDVAVLADRVVVYENDISRNGLEANAVYVVEYQRPRAGMARRQWAELELSHGGGRFETSREAVRIFQRPEVSGDLWWFSHARSLWMDGPINEFNLVDMIVGRVIGVYDPSRCTKPADTAEFDAAMAAYSEKRAFADGLPDDGDPDEFDRALDDYCVAMDRLVEDVPAPTLEHVLIKFELAKGRCPEGELFEEYRDAIVADIARLAGSGVAA